MSIVEMLGVIGVILILAVLAVPGFKNMTAGAKNSVASRNVATLNSAVEQFNQAGGLMTSQVKMQIGSSADEMEAFCLLTSQEKIGNLSGQFLSSVQKPVISSDPTLFKAVWVSDYDLGNATKSASGARDPVLEKLLAAGTIQGGRFEMVGPGISITTPKGTITSSAPGIVAFSKDGTPCSAVLALATPRPATGTNYTLTLGVSPAGAGTITGAGSFASGAIANFTATAGANHTFGHWDTDLVGLLATDKVTMTANKRGIAYFLPKTVTVQLDALPANAGTTTGSGTYNSNTELQYTATPTQAGFKFLNWTGPDAAKLASISLGAGTIAKLTSDIRATANFAENTYTVTIGAPAVKTATGAFIVVSNVATVEPATPALNFRDGDVLNMKSTPVWSSAWNQPRYRWETFQFRATAATTANAASATAITTENKGTGSSPTSTWSISQGISSDMTITPIVVQQQFITANSNNVSWGMVTLNGTNSQGIQSIFDRGTVVNLLATPNSAVARFTNWSNASTTGTLAQTLNADTALTANFSDQQFMTVRVIDQFGEEVPARFYNLTGLKSGRTEYKIGATPTGTLTLANTKVYEYTSIKGADAVLDTPGKYTITSLNPISFNTEEIITITLKVTRQLMVYWEGSQGELDGGAKTVIVASAKRAAIYKAAGGYGVTTVQSSGTQDWGTQVTGGWTSFVDWRHTNPGNWAQSMSSAVYRTTTQYQQLYYTYYNYLHTYYSTNLVVYDSATDTIMGTLPASAAGQIPTNGAATVLNGGFNGEYIGYYARNIAAVGWQSGYTWHSGPWYDSYDWQSGWWNSLSPIIVDLSKTGKPDLLAGTLWWNDSQRTPVIDAFRLFDLDGTGPKYWEWTGPKAGILVWNPTGNKLLQPTGKDLFGNVTWGKEWEDGYKALATLDINKSGILELEESKDVWVWRDLNSNAIVEEGELTTLEDQKISTLVVTPQYKDGNSGAYSPIGAIVDGEPVPTWDWISLGGTIEKPVAPAENEPTIYKWRVLDQLMPVGGELIFTKTEGGWNLKSVPSGQKEGMETVANIADGVVSWTFGPLDTKAEVKGNTLVGESTFNGMVTKWEGVKMSGPAIFLE